MLKLRHIMSYGLMNGFMFGMCINNNIYLKINNKKSTTIPLPPTPLLFGILGGAITPLCVACSPLILYNYLSKNAYCDKIFDKYKNCIFLERYHQHDVLDNKYYSSSDLYINININEMKQISL